MSDPTQASFPFHHANAFADAGHDVQIFLLGEGVTLMRTVVANSVFPVGFAGAVRGVRKRRRQEDSDPCLRGVREGPWGP